MAKFVQLKRKAFDSAKVAAMKGKLFGDEKLKEFSRMSFEQILKYLEEHDYKQSVDTSYIDFEGFYLIERVLNTHLSKVYTDVFAYSSKETKKLLEKYYLKYQIHNLMALARCRIADESELEPYLIGDERKKEKFLKAYEMPDVEDALVYLSKKLGLDSKMVVEMHSKGLYELENYLYGKYYESICSVKFIYNNLDERKFILFISEYIDLINARTFIKLKLEDLNISFEEIFVLGGNLNREYFEKLSNESVENILSELKKDFEEIKSCKEHSCVASIDRAISLLKEDSILRFKIASFGSPFYILRYLFEVEREMGKLRIILKGKYLGLDENKLEELVR